MKQFRAIWVAVGMLLLPFVTKAQGLRLDECQRLAKENYPLLKKYDLIRQTTDFTVSNLNKGYLPQLSLGGQVSYQSDVMTLPGALQDMLESNGYDVKGLGKDQYKVSLDLNQIIYDGGNIRAGKEVARAEGEADSRQTDVDMYALRDRVNDLFFGILLTEDKLRLNEDLQTLLADNCRKIEAMLSGGTAMQSDVDAVRAEYLNARQQHTELESARDSYRAMLAIFIGRKIDAPLVKPEATEPIYNKVMRPELRLFDAQSSLTDARRKQLDAGIRSTVSLFAQGYYGYPGYDMFNDMFDHDWTLNGIIGVRLSWNIGKLYTHKNDLRKLDVARNEIENAREVFLFNNSLQSTEDRAAIDRYRRMMEEDSEIIALRTSVRQSAEAKLEHGTIDVNDLLQEITRENRARIDHSTHEIEMLKSIYELKNTLNQ